MKALVLQDGWLITYILPFGLVVVQIVSPIERLTQIFRYKRFQSISPNDRSGGDTLIDKGFH